MAKHKGIIYLLISILLTFSVLGTIETLSSFTNQTNPFNITFSSNENSTQYLSIPRYSYVQNMSLNLRNAIDNNMTTYDKLIFYLDGNNESIIDRVSLKQVSHGLYIYSKPFGINNWLSYNPAFTSVQPSHLFLNLTGDDNHYNISKTVNTRNVSVSLWINISDVKSELQHTIFNSNTDGNGRFGLHINSSNQLMAYFFDGDYPTDIILNNHTVYHIVVLLNSSATTDYIIYINSIESYRLNKAYPSYDYYTRFYIMANPLDGNSYNLNGTITNIAIFNKTINQTQINALYYNNDTYKNFNISLFNSNIQEYNINFTINVSLSMNITKINSILSSGCTCTNCSIDGSNCKVPFTFHSDTAGILSVNLTNATFNNYGRYYYISAYAYDSLISDITTVTNTSNTYYTNPALLDKLDYDFNESISYNITDNTGTYTKAVLTTTVDYWSTGINISMLGGNITLAFTEGVDLIVYMPTRTENYSNVVSINKDLNDWDEGLISIRIAKTGTNIYRQYFELLNTRIGSVNKTIKIVTSPNIQTYVETTDLSRAPRKEAEVSLFLRNSTNNLYELVSQRITQEDGKTYFWSLYNDLYFYKIISSKSDTSTTPIYTQLNESNTETTPIRSTLLSNSTSTAVPSIQYESPFYNRSHPIDIEMFYLTSQDIVFTTDFFSGYTSASSNFRYWINGTVYNPSSVWIVQGQYHMTLQPNIHFDTAGTSNITVYIWNRQATGIPTLISSFVIEYKALTLQDIAPIEWNTLDSDIKTPLALIALLLICIIAQFIFVPEGTDSSNVGKNLFLIGSILLPLISTNFIPLTIVSLFYYGLLGLKKVISNTG